MRRLSGETAHRPPSFHAYVSDDQRIALFSGVAGIEPATGEIAPGGLVAQVKQAARMVASICRGSELSGEPQLIVRIHEFAREEYLGAIDAIGDCVREAMAPMEPAVNVTLVSRLGHAGALVEIDGVLVEP